MGFYVLKFRNFAFPRFHESNLFKTSELKQYFYCCFVVDHLIPPMLSPYVCNLVSDSEEVSYKVLVNFVLRNKATNLMN